VGRGHRRPARAPRDRSAGHLVGAERRPLHARGSAGARAQRLLDAVHRPRGSAPAVRRSRTARGDDHIDRRLRRSARAQLLGASRRTAACDRAVRRSGHRHPASACRTGDGGSRTRRRSTPRHHDAEPGRDRLVRRLHAGSARQSHRHGEEGAAHQAPRRALVACGEHDPGRGG
jgi:hypothetical protein